MRVHNNQLRINKEEKDDSLCLAQSKYLKRIVVWSTTELKGESFYTGTINLLTAWAHYTHKMDQTKFILSATPVWQRAPSGSSKQSISYFSLPQSNHTFHYKGQYNRPLSHIALGTFKPRLTFPTNKKEPGSVTNICFKDTYHSIWNQIVWNDAHWQHLKH